MPVRLVQPVRLVRKVGFHLPVRLVQPVGFRFSHHHFPLSPYRLSPLRLSAFQLVDRLAPFRLFPWLAGPGLLPSLFVVDGLGFPREPVHSALSQ